MRAFSDNRNALGTMENMGDLHALQGETTRARALYERSLSGLLSILGLASDECMALAAKIDACLFLGLTRQTTNG